MSNVSHPKHYNQGKIEVIEFIEDKQLNFHRGNAVKYICRAGLKDPAKEIEDLDKAIWYIKREAERILALKEGRQAMKPNDMSKPALETYECNRHNGPPVLSEGDRCNLCEAMYPTQASCT